MCSDFFSSNYYWNVFFLNPECQQQSIIHRRFRHFWRHFQRIGLTSSQFWIKSGVEVRWKRSNNLENGEEYILFFLRMTLDCLKCVHQFRESILRRFVIERQRTRSHFDGIRFRPFEKERKETHSTSFLNGSERYLFSCRTFFESKRKHSIITWNEKECVPLKAEQFFPFRDAFSIP